MDFNMLMEEFEEMKNLREIVFSDLRSVPEERIPVISEGQVKTLVNLISMGCMDGKGNISSMAIFKTMPAHIIAAIERWIDVYIVSESDKSNICLVLIISLVISKVKELVMTGECDFNFFEMGLKGSNLALKISDTVRQWAMFPDTTFKTFLENDGQPGEFNFWMRRLVVSRYKIFG